MRNRRQCKKKIFVSVDIVVIETGGTYNWTYIDDYGVYAAPGDNLLFKVRAKTDVHVSLTRYCLCVTFCSVPDVLLFTLLCLCINLSKKKLRTLVELKLDDIYRFICNLELLHF